MQPRTDPPPAHGDEAALFEHYDRNLRQAVARRIDAPAPLIEDACQFAWMRLIDCQPDRSRVFGWLYVVAVHECYRLLEITRREPDYDPVTTLPALAEAHEDTIDLQLEAREALAVLAALPERQQRDLGLLVAGFSYKEIQAMTPGRTWTNVSKTIKKARARARLERLRATPSRAKGAKSSDPSS